jgi:hypothetical protein
MIFNETDFSPTPPPAKRPPAELPPGTYSAVIKAEETKPTKAGTGEYLQLILEVDEGPHAGARVFERLNLRNPSVKAMAIAQETLVRICEAAGMDKPGDSSELVGKRLQVTTVNETYQDKTYARIRGYAPHPEGQKQREQEFLDDLPF